MAVSCSERDLDVVPDLTFSFVEEYIKSRKTASGDKPVNKGFKYFSEGYIHDLKVRQLNSDGCDVSGKCYHSQRKNEQPHTVKISFIKGDTTVVQKAECSCPEGLSEACGHMTGLLYQLAKFKLLNMKALPEDVAKTSQPQTWHVRRGDKLRGKEVQDIEVSGYRKSDLDRDSAPRVVKSTLYNPVRGDQIDWSTKHDILSDASPDMLVLPALKNQVTMVNTRFGKFPKRQCPELPSAPREQLHN